MKFAKVEQLANAVLYEGYILYPYRPSSVKNQKRFNFGVVVPPAYAAAEGGSEASGMRTECLVLGGAGSTLEMKVRFLQVIGGGSWQDVVERSVSLAERNLGSLGPEPLREEFHFPPLDGAVEVTASRLNDGLFQVAAQISNLTSIDMTKVSSRDDILPSSAVSTHTMLAVTGGAFVSMFDPPEALREAAGRCRNFGAWPILAGEEGDRSLMLSSPIILYDYAQVAAESPGDLFDGTEIDEILTLRILTMTEEEKREMREADDRGRRILERTENLPAEHFMKLHGALRGLHPANEEKQ